MMEERNTDVTANLTERVANLEALITDMLRHLRIQQGKMRDSDKASVEKLVIEGYQRRYYRAMGGARAVRRRMQETDAGQSTESQFEVDFATNLNRLLVEKSVSQADLAKKLDLSAAAVNKYCKGQMTPKFDVLVDIARILDVDMNDLLFAPEEM